MKIIGYIAALLLCSNNSFASEEHTTLWKIRVSTDSKEYTFIPTKTRSNIPYTSCTYSPVSRFTNVNGDVLEYLKVECKTGINGTVAMMQSCYAEKYDDSTSIMTIDDKLMKYTIQVSCITL